MRQINDREERCKNAVQEFAWNEFIPPLIFPSNFPYTLPVLPLVLTDFLVIRKDEWGEPLVFQGPEENKLSIETNFLDTDFAKSLAPEILYHNLDAKNKIKAEKEKSKGKEEKKKVREEIYGELVLDKHYAVVNISPDHLGYIFLLDPENTFNVKLDKIKKEDVVLYNYSLAGKVFMYRVKELPKCIVAYIGVNPDGSRFSDYLWIADGEQCEDNELNVSPLNHIVIRKAKHNPYKQFL